MAGSKCDVDGNLYVPKLASDRPMLNPVVKINPVRKLYEAHGFRITHDDEYKYHMRLDKRPMLPCSLLSRPAKARARGQRRSGYLGPRFRKGDKRER